MLIYLYSQCFQNCPICTVTYIEHFVLSVDFLSPFFHGLHACHSPWCLIDVSPRTMHCLVVGALSERVRFRCPIHVAMGGLAIFPSAGA